MRESPRSLPPIPTDCHRCGCLRPTARVTPAHADDERTTQRSPNVTIHQLAACSAFLLRTNPLWLTECFCPKFHPISVCLVLDSERGQVISTRHPQQVMLWTPDRMIERPAATHHHPIHFGNEHKVAQVKQVVTSHQVVIMQK